MAHKGDMWTTACPGSTLAKDLQPDYSITNLRLRPQSRGAAGWRMYSPTSPTRRDRVHNTYTSICARRPMSAGHRLRLNLPLAKETNRIAAAAAAAAAAWDHEDSALPLDDAGSRVVPVSAAAAETRQTGAVARQDPTMEEAESRSGTRASRTTDCRRRHQAVSAFKADERVIVWPAIGLPGIIDAHTHPAQSARMRASAGSKTRSCNRAANQGSFGRMPQDHPGDSRLWFEVIQVNATCLTFAR